MAAEGNNKFSHFLQKMSQHCYVNQTSPLGRVRPSPHAHKFRRAALAGGDGGDWGGDGGDFGGDGGDIEILASAEFFDVDATRWVEIPPMRVARLSADVVMDT